MKKYFAIFLMTAVFVACQESLEERGQREARDYTEKHCPAPVALQVTMDSMTFDKTSHTFCYSYTLSGMLDDSAYISQNNPRELLLQQVRNSTNLRIYKDAGYNFRYVYNSTTYKGLKLFDQTFTPKDYN